MLLKDRVILVTGAGRGIGRGIAEAVAEAGGVVVATDLESGPARETAQAVEEAGRRALALVCDVTDADTVSHAIEETVETFGRLDGLVNNAGLLVMDTALGATAEDWDRQFRVNAGSLFACCQLAARQMITQGGGGAIVNVASNAGKVGYPDMAAYNASKAAVISLTRSLAGEWAEHHINVNAVCPGGVATDMLRSVADTITQRRGGDANALFGSMVPAQLGRHIEPVEVGRVVAFLLSDHAVIIRGQAINVDGGDTPY
jgi:NAD(P)-dependent dehydrogenase (short-subunit alcohol dehydrogenase family)